MSLAFQDPPSRNRDELVIRGDLANEVREQLAPEIKRLEQLLRALVPDEPKTPVVNVEAKSAPPTVNVTGPKVEPYVDVSVPGMSEFAKELASLRADVATLTSVLSTPSIRTVERDVDGRITRIIDRRA